MFPPDKESDLLEMLEPSWCKFLPKAHDLTAKPLTHEPLKDISDSNHNKDSLVPIRAV